jgi:hypothetical protein
MARSVHVTSFEILLEPLLPAAWLAASLSIAAYGHYVVALGFAFVFFLTGLRLIHNAFHTSLGLSRCATDIVLWIMSLTMLGSMPAVQFNHLRHHRLALGEDDVEGRHAEMPAWRVLFLGPAFPILLHVTALRYGNWKLRATVVVELFLNAAWITLIFRVWNKGMTDRSDSTLNRVRPEDDLLARHHGLTSSLFTASLRVPKTTSRNLRQQICHQRWENRFRPSCLLKSRGLIFTINTENFLG